MRKTVSLPERLRVSCPSALHYIIIWVFHWNSEWLGTTFFKSYNCRAFWNGRGVYSSSIRSSSKIDRSWYKPASIWIFYKWRNPTASLVANRKKKKLVKIVDTRVLLNASKLYSEKKKERKLRFCTFKYYNFGSTMDGFSVLAVLNCLRIHKIPVLKVKKIIFPL